MPTILATAFLAFTGGTPATTAAKHKHFIKGCNTAICQEIVGRKWWRKHHPKPKFTGPHYFIKENVTCYHEGSQTSDGGPVYVGEVANNFLPLETRIKLDRPVFGRTEFVVKDHIGEGSDLDIYGPSQAACEAFGRQSLGFTVLR